MSLKYKIGDRVRIKSIDWYNENKDEYGHVACGYHVFTEYMSNFCGRTMIVCNITNLGVMTMDGSTSYWTDEMIEGLVEEEVDLIPKFGEYSDNEPLDIPTMTTEFVKEHGLPCPEGYIFKDDNGNVINATKIVLEKEKKEYPKSFGECCKVLGTYSHNQSIVGYKNELFNALQKLIICRDAYWKIAGDEMGLGKSWEPKWWDGLLPKYVFYNYSGNIDKGACYFDNAILAFPTAKMRDAFYENFKKEIEICKELL